MVGESTGRCGFSAVGIEGSRWVLDVLSVVQVERKNTRVIEKSSGKTRRANSPENRNKSDRVVPRLASHKRAESKLITAHHQTNALFGRECLVRLHAGE